MRGTMYVAPVARANALDPVLRLAGSMPIPKLGAQLAEVPEIVGSPPRSNTDSSRNDRRVSLACLIATTG